MRRFPPRTISPSIQSREIIHATDVELMTIVPATPKEKACVVHSINIVLSPVNEAVSLAVVKAIATIGVIVHSWFDLEIERHDISWHNC